MTRLKIALMAGGDSPERGIALQSAAQIEAALDHTKYDITVIDLHHRDWHYTAPDGREWQVDKNDFSLTVEGERKAFDYALIIIHGTPGEDGKLQGYLDMMGVPYSSCSMTSSVITFDKITTKRTVAGRGINLAREIFLCKGETADPDRVVAEFGLPLFIKPNASGSSFGVTKVHTRDEVLPAIEAAFAQSDEVLIEECIAGREMGCGMMVAGGREYLFPITEIVSKKDFFDYQAKYTEGYSDEITPADIAPEIAEELHRMTRIAYRACRCSGVVRVDFIVTPEGKPYLIEINSIPGMSAGQHRPQASTGHGHVAGGDVRPDYRRHLPQMIEIDDKIVSADLLRECFACDIAQCKGICCVEGNAGAPLEAEEVGILEREYAAYKPYMTPEGIEAVERQGFMVIDEDGDLTTPLVGDAECAYTYQENGITLCAIEKAWLEGKTAFRKPISCHLYPIRVVRFSNGTAGLNYHRWSVCAPARECGRRLGIPVYKALREPIVRRFGEEFYKALEAAEEFIRQQ